MIAGKCLIPLYLHVSTSGRFQPGGARHTLKSEHVYTFEPIPDALTQDASRTFWKESSGGTAIHAYIEAPDGHEMVETEPEGPGHKLLRIDGVTMTAGRARNHALVANYDLRLWATSEVVNG